MDLGIKGKNAIVCAASKGLGKGCAMALAKEGVNITITARTAETLEQTAAELRKLGGGTITAVAGDITTLEGRAKVLAACPNPDILINNAGGPPAGRAPAGTARAHSITVASWWRGWTSLRRPVGDCTVANCSAVRWWGRPAPPWGRWSPSEGLLALDPPTRRPDRQAGPRVGPTGPDHRVPSG